MIRKFLNPSGKLTYEEALRQAGERVEKERKDYLTTSNDNTWVERRNGKQKNKHLKKRGIKGAKSHALWKQEHPVLNAVGTAAGAAPLAVAAYPFAAGAGELAYGIGSAAAATTAGQILLPWIDAGLTSYFGAHGLNHAINEGVNGWGDAAMTALEITPLGRLIKPIYKGIVQPVNTASKTLIDNSKITETERLSKQLNEHVQGDEAVKMFKEYGGEPIPEGSINGEQLRKYVTEARERYGLVGNNNVTDEEIAQALYKHSKELGGNTAAINALGEPLLLFRGDTRRYTQLKERMSPEELATKSGTMDNSLGTLFLGELPGTAGKHTRGLERYLVTGRDFMGQKRLEGSGTGSRAIMPDGTFATEWGNMINMFPEGSYPLVTYNTRIGPNTYYKLPSNISESGVNDINAFVVRTPQVRDASREISVLNDDFMVKGGPKVEYHGPIRREILDKDGFPLIVDEKGNVVANGLAGSSDRQAMALHYRYVLNDAKNKKQGLLKSNGETDGTPGNYLRDEHDDYTYFALPNFNIQGAKHLLPYDLRIPRNWKDKNIYRGLIPLATGYTSYNLFNQPLQKSLYYKQGGKMNTILFLQEGNGIFQQKLGQLKRTLASTLKERQQEQANRLNSSNYSGRFVGLVNEEFFGKPMSEDEKNNITIKNSSKNSLKDSKNYYGSQEYANRLRSAGVNMSNAGRLLNKLNTVNTYSIGENTARRLNKIGNGKDLSSTFRAMTMYRPVVVDGKRYDPGVYYNRGLMHNGLGEGVYGTFVHEYSHWADKALTPDATAYNHSLIKLNPNLNEKEKQYYGNDSEIRARAMDILMNYNHNKSKYKNLNDFLRKEGSMKGVMELRKTFKDENSFQNYMNHFVLNDNSGMNQDGIYYSKKGNKIHIKKANRGKFTDYCGGKVTNECILRGKNSSDPAVRKRATFAANARKWNHKKGGVIVAEGGIKLGNIFSKAQEFFNSNTGRSVKDLAVKLYSGVKESNNLRKQEEQLLKDYNYISKQINTLDVINKTNQLFQELQLQDPNIHVSEIDWRNLYGKNEGIAKQLAQANARNYLVNARQLMMLLNSQSSGGGLDFSGLINAGALLLAGNKNKTNTGTTNTTTTNTQIPSTATPTYFSSGFDWSKPTLASAIKFST